MFSLFKTTHADISRDFQYWQVYVRDVFRQHVRRWAHGIGVAYERQVGAPKWQRVSGSQKSPTLSTCIITMNSANRIRPLLEYIRTFSDEIVVGVDSKTTDETWAACEGVADELFWIQNDALTCNAGLEELVKHCHGEWVLRLDDDEWVEPVFADYKDGLLLQTDCTHFKIPRLHVCGHETVSASLDWIDDGYLYPDYQMRLFRNEAALLSYPGAVGHTSIQCIGKKGRVNSVNIVHLNLAMNPREQREAKLSRYIQRLNGGWVHPVNEHALLFEDFNYRIKPYTYPDTEFRKKLCHTLDMQQAAFERQKLLQPTG